MKQKVSLYALIKLNNKVLLLRRAKGREDIIGKYELPGGELPGNSSPPEALAQYLHAQTGQEPMTMQLHDVRAYPSQYDAQTQRIDIVYSAALPPASSIELSPRHSKYVWRKLQEVLQNDVTEATHNLLIDLQSAQQTKETVAKPAQEVDESATMRDAIIYSDGGSRGNPGPSASGFVILNNNEQLVEEGGAYLGITTNNQAEYHAVRLALEAAAGRGIRNIQFRIDSLLVVNQMNGVYKIKNRDLWPVHQRIRELAAGFDHVSFSHVRREFNKEADAMVNKILDEHKNT